AHALGRRTWERPTMRKWMTANTSIARCTAPLRVSPDSPSAIASAPHRRAGAYADRRRSDLEWSLYPSRGGIGEGGLDAPLGQVRVGAQDLLRRFSGR